MRGWIACPRCAGTGSGEGFRACGLRPVRFGESRPNAPMTRDLSEAEKTAKKTQIIALARECCPEAGALLVGMGLGEWVMGKLSDEVIVQTVKDVLVELRKFLESDECKAISEEKPS